MRNVGNILLLTSALLMSTVNVKAQKIDFDLFGQNSITITASEEGIHLSRVVNIAVQ